MPRGEFVSLKRNVEPDWIYRSRLLGLFLCHLMERGKKTLAEKILYGAFDVIEASTGQDPLRVFEQALRNVAPEMGVVSTRRGRSIRHYPVRLRTSKRVSVSFKWILASARKRQGGGMAYKLAREIIGTAQNNSASIKKKRALYKVVKDNHMYRLPKKKLSNKVI
jgi:small subunit ribosomal protein S7